MPQTARAFMGPNLYISPGGGFTHLHQDGHGTVDSGHYVVSGYNEVLILRRMPERHKQNASNMMPGAAAGSGRRKQEYDPLYSLPHGDTGDQGERPDWPHNKTIEDWKAMKYVFIKFTVIFLHPFVAMFLTLHLNSSSTQLLPL